MQDYEIAVVGAGMAGASVAGTLAADPAAPSVVMLEMESVPGYHTTGRSAALFSKIYGPAPIRALSRASEAFFDAPPAGFSDHPLLSPRGMVMTARDDQEDAFSVMVDGLGGAAHLEVVSERQARALCPLLRPGYAAQALWDDDARDVDVHALHQGFLRQFRAAGGTVLCGAEVAGLSRDGGRWRIETSAGVLRAAIVVNAAGAWADRIATQAGVAPIGLEPRRRSAAIIEAPDGLDLATMRMVVDVEEAFYLKPEAGTLLISPADETPSPPCDAQPEDIDIAVAVDRIERAFDIEVRRIERKWAGLRSFVADGHPVAGFDPGVEGFFWLVGQGGYGIQTAPALGRLAAALVLGRPMPVPLVDHGVRVADLAATRLERAG